MFEAYHDAARVLRFMDKHHRGVRDAFYNRPGMKTKKKSVVKQVQREIAHAQAQLSFASYYLDFATMCAPHRFVDSRHSLWCVVSPIIA